MRSSAKIAPQLRFVRKRYILQQESSLKNQRQHKRRRHLYWRGTKFLNGPGSLIEMARGAISDFYGERLGIVHRNRNGICSITNRAELIAIHRYLTVLTLKAIIVFPFAGCQL